MRLDHNRTHCCDCLKGMGEIEDGEIDVIVTSPPYNIGKRYNTYSDRRPDEEYSSWMEAVGEECSRVLDSSGSIFLNLGFEPKDPWKPFDTARRFGKDLFLQNVIIWVKSIAIDGDGVGKRHGINGTVTLGHYKPVLGSRFLNNCFEYIFHFSKKGDVRLDRLSIGVPYTDKSNVARWKGAGIDRKCRGNVWFIPYDTIQSETERPHPTTFPPKLPMMCIMLHGLSRTSMVMDPFMGIGNTAVACRRLGIDYIGFEIDSEYCSIANRRASEEHILTEPVNGRMQ